MYDGMEAAGMFENAWAEHILERLNKEDKKSVSQVDSLSFHIFRVGDPEVRQVRITRSRM